MEEQSASESQVPCTLPAKPAGQDTPKSTAKKTRKTAEIFGLGKGITVADGTITGSRLPTSRQILRCLMYHYQQGITQSKTRNQAARIVLGQVIPFYGKANIPMISEIKTCQKMVKLLDDNAKLRAIPIARRTAPATLDKLKLQETELDKTFQLWPSNAEQLIKNPEDLQFLLSMKTDRVATFGSTDNVLAERLKRKHVRENAKGEQRKRACHEMTASTSTCVLTSSTDEDSESESSQPEYVEHPSDTESSSITSTPTTQRPHRSTKTGTTAFIPGDILKTPKLVSVATRMKISPAQQSALIGTLIEEAGGDPEKVNLSYSYSDKSRRQVADDIAFSCKEEWQPPKYGSLNQNQIRMSRKNVYLY